MPQRRQTHWWLHVLHPTLHIVHCTLHCNIWPLYVNTFTAYTPNSIRLILYILFIALHCSAIVPGGVYVMHPHWRQVAMAAAVQCSTYPIHLFIALQWICNVVMYPVPVYPRCRQVAMSVTCFASYTYSLHCIALQCICDVPSTGIPPLQAGCACSRLFCAHYYATPPGEPPSFLLSPRFSAILYLIPPPVQWATTTAVDHLSCSGLPQCTTGGSHYLMMQCNVIWYFAITIAKAANAMSFLNSNVT